MAETAEHVHMHSQIADFTEWEVELNDSAIDFQQWEAEVSSSDSYARPPESEIYGRSLSTIRRLGAFMIEHASAEVVNSPEAAQARVEFYTSVEEGFGTDMELGGGLEVRDFDSRPVMDGKVVADDLKTAVSTMTESGLKCAIEKVKVELAEKDNRFIPQLIRSKWDHQNAVIVDSMTQGKTDYNTRIVISPFPEEAAARSGNAYWRHIGYVPHLKRGFVQLYHWDGVQEVLAGSLSFDGSNKQRLRDLFGAHGVEIPADEVTDNWLKYAITGNLNAEEAKKLATDIADEAGDPAYKKDTNTVDVTQQYKPIMERVFNESYVHICESLVRGQQTEGAHELICQLTDQAHHFNERYAKALYSMRANKSRFTDDDSIVLHELLVYSTIEMMRALHLKEKDNENIGVAKHAHISSTAAYLQSLDSANFQNALSGAGADGAKNNRGYSACGLEVNLGDANAPKDSPQSAYAGNVNKDSDKFGQRTFKCKNGHTNHRPLNEMITECWVPNCKDSVGCDPKSGKSKSKDNDAKKKPKQEAVEADPELVADVEDAFADKNVANIEAEEKQQAQQRLGQLGLSQ